MSFIRSFSITFATKAITLLLLLACRILTARLLGPAELGVFGAALNLTTLISRWGSLGTVPATQVMVAQNLNSKQALLTFTILSSTILGLLNILLVWLFEGQIIHWQFSNSGASSNVFRQLYPFFPIILLSMTLPIYLLGLGQYRKYALTQIIPLSIQAIILLISAKITLDLIIIAQFVYWLSTVMIGCILIGYRNFNFIFPTALFHKYIHFSVGIWPLIIVQFGIARFTILAGSQFLTPKELGEYLLASNISEAFFFIHTSLTPIILNQTKSGIDQSKFLVRSLRLSNLILIFVCLAVLLIGKLPFLYLFGVDYLKSWNLLLWLLPGVLMHGMVAVFLSQLIASSKKQIAFYIQLTTLMVLIAFSLLLCPVYRAVGLCFAGFLSSFAAWICCIMVRKRNDGDKFEIMSLFIPTAEDWHYLQRLGSKWILR